ncbi:hypothetical protein VIBNISOn1_1840083 [Vibrio nigripulchritudo SOn1]|uniref:Transposase n=1 Tax=Vibrio nigripulchritudo SOn1 TaxID=1238450 RepID=A0AAV2VQF6_9VIBR|nr:hypothetical protein VIBNISOn1_1840083 [Vibrio nigripulchritudo SOn1]
MTVTKTVIEKQYPPASWLEDCPDPELKGNTFKDAVIQSLERRSVIDKCNLDKRSLREWRGEGKNVGR